MIIKADDERDAPGGEDDVDTSTGTAGKVEGGDDDDQGDDDDHDNADDQGPGDDDQGGDDGDDEEDIIVLGNEAAPASEDDSSTPQWVKDLRKQNRELQRENAALKTGKPAAEPAAVKQLRAKPTLSDHEFDEDAFAADLEAWHGEKAEIEAAKTEQARQQDAAKAAWQGKLDSFGQKKAALKVPDFDDAEAAVTATLSQAQIAVIVAYAANPAVVTYALGKRPDKLAELAKIGDPIAFAIAASKLEGELKVMKRNKNKPDPEGRVSGDAPSGGTRTDKKLERLEKQALETGNRTELIAYRRELRAKGKL